MNSRLARHQRVFTLGVRSFSVRSSAWNDPWRDELRSNVQALSNTSTSEVRRRADALVARASAQFSDLGAKLSQATGYNEIEDLKKAVYAREQEIKDIRIEAREAKKAYEIAVAERSTCQRQVNDLLQRKSSWTEADVSLFTTLVRQDHEFEQAEVRAKQRSAAAELRQETQFNELMRAILNRYHEEQIWSDKIRSVSTYGSLGALGLNLVVFILAIVIVEPWKRKRLGETFEQRMMVLEKENQALMRDSMQNLEDHFDKQQQILARLAALTTLTPVDHSIAPVDEEAPPPTVENYSPIDILENALSIQRLRDARVISAVGGAIGGALLMYIVGR